MIISFLNEKGGVGKTTLATNVAHGLQMLGHSVLLVDSDKQGSVRDWHVTNDGSLLDVIGLDRPTLDKDIQKFKKKYDFIIIDGAPQLKEMVLRALLCSDVVLIPAQPSQYDIWASKNVVELIKQRQAVNNGYPKAAFVINRQIVGTSLGKEVRGVLQEYELPVFTSGTYQRVIYSETIADGQTVLLSNNTQAKNEIHAIVNELLEFINV